MQKVFRYSHLNTYYSRRTKDRPAEKMFKFDLARYADYIIFSI